MKMALRISTAFALLVAAVGCSKSSSSGGQPPFQIDPPTLTTAAGGAPVQFRALLDSAPATATWTLEGPGTIAPASGATTTYTPPSSASSQTTATLTARSGDYAATATITLTGGAPITVQGKVIFNGGGDPAPNIKLQVGATVTQTDAQGRFSVQNVPVPYDVVLFDASEDGMFVVLVAYRGLTRPDPTLTLATATAVQPQTLPKTATVTGRISGGAGFPQQMGTFTNLVFSSQVTSYAETAPDMQTGNYSMQLHWADAPSLTASVLALQTVMSLATNRITSFPGYGTKTFVVGEGETKENVDVPLAAVQTGQLTGTVNVPNGYYIAEREYTLQFEGTNEPMSMDREHAEIVSRDPSLAPAFSALMPHIANAKLTLTVKAGLQSAIDMLANEVTVTQRGIALDEAQPVTIDVPQAPEIIAPEDNQESVGPATAFRWNASGGLKRLGSLASVGSAGQKSITFIIYTCADRTMLPDPTPFGLEFPKNAGYVWQLMETREVTSIDTAVGGPIERVGAELPVVTVGASETRNFKTAP